MSNNKAHPGTNPDADDRGVGEDTIGDFLLEPFQALNFTDPLDVAVGTYNKLLSCQEGENSPPSAV